MEITWVNTKIKISDLKEFDINPRTISKKDFQRLVNDIKQDGYHRRILVDTNNTIIGGHSRKQALLASGLAPECEIEVLKASRPLSENEFKRLNIRDNLDFGDFDTELLANHFDPVELSEWGMDLEEIGFDMETDVTDKPSDEKEKCKMCGK
jgi:ParB-like chromosome segregation protein Spo0J